MAKAPEELSVIVSTKEYRPGAVGALLDIYERAIHELIQFAEHIPPGEYTEVLDAETEDEDCRTVQTILGHVVRSGYQYADYIKQAFELTGRKPKTDPVTHETAGAQLGDMMSYTLAAIEPMCSFPYDRFDNIHIKTSWGQEYDFEQLMEHAIVHALRHHRQIERLQAVKSASA